MERIELTPDLASQLLSKPHPRQRRPAQSTVTQYANEIRRGRWRPYVPDAILVDHLGRMFNGAHRCAAVVAAGMGIGVLIERDADPELFDVIDVGRKRSAYQFIQDGEATVRASAARVMLWYRYRVDRELNARTLSVFDLAEILGAAEAAAADMTRAMPHARAIHDWTGIGQSVALAVLVLAAQDEIDFHRLVEFREGIVDPTGLDPRDARRVLADKTRQSRWRERRRQQIDDWTVLVKTLNAFLFDEPVTALTMSRFWPLIGERMAEYDRRRKQIADREHGRRKRSKTSATTTSVTDAKTAHA